ncbi:hypothetical protein BDV93DRAFT_115350 [Ceratobasidium sp. AG-I]|nr:hypothetical protein BDV93DRAFT_115350 [Ceratobasidium sp. AG-I]
MTAHPPVVNYQRTKAGAGAAHRFHLALTGLALVLRLALAIVSLSLSLSSAASVLARRLGLATHLPLAVSAYPAVAVPARSYSYLSLQPHVYPLQFVPSVPAQPEYSA